MLIKSTFFKKNVEFFSQCFDIGFKCEFFIVNSFIYFQKPIEITFKIHLDQFQIQSCYLINLFNIKRFNLLDGITQKCFRKLKKFYSDSGAKRTTSPSSSFDKNSWQPKRLFSSTKKA